MRVALIDDDEAVLDSLGLYLNRQGMAVDRFESAERFLASRSAGTAFDCIVTDVRMPGLSGLDLVRKLVGTNERAAVILITGHGDVDMAVKAIKLGAFDFLEKPFNETRLVDAINLAAGQAAERQQQASHADELKQRLDNLSERQKQVFDRAVKGASNKTIARDLNISVRTVEIHRAWVMERMGARNIAELVRMDTILNGAAC